ncbi:hypothetical protein ACQEVZ_06210 [Dactylosporangium sp. CA-152071]|uniref:hypothetical protein n=1 Tax=Dactylosporangium sp. CA-152071 TaxID=3239933 RepID=UPI003D8A6C83
MGTSVPAMRYFGLCLGHADEREAERWLRTVGVPAAVEVRTVRVDGVVALSFAVPEGTALELPAQRIEFAAAGMRAAALHAAQHPHPGSPGAGSRG